MILRQAGDFDGPVSLWNLDTLEKIKDLAASGGYDTSDAELSPDGQYLAADFATGISLWQVSDGSRYGMRSRIAWLSPFLQTVDISLIRM